MTRNECCCLGDEARVGHNVEHTNDGGCFDEVEYIVMRWLARKVAPDWKRVLFPRSLS